MLEAGPLLGVRAAALLRSAILGFCISLAPPTWAQAALPDAPTRADAELAAERAKAAHLTPNRPPHSEEIFDRLEANVINRVFIPEGFSIAVGGLPTGGGFSLGPRYTFNHLLRDRLVWDSSVIGSTQLWWRGQTSFAFPHLAGDHLAASVRSAYEDAASLEYYGEGSNSSHADKSNFRREFTTAQAELSVHDPARRLEAGYRVGGLLVNVGPGRRDSPPSTTLLFNEANTPGLERQSNFLTGTGFFTLDLTRKGFNDPSGLQVDALETQFWDQSRNAYGFTVLRTQASYRFTFLNGLRTLAFKVRNETAFHSAGNTVPFYLQPTLGGPNDLRGYNRYRFYDNGSSLVTAEYHWTVAQTLELALFADGGNVYGRPGLIGLRDARGDGGIGVRFKNKDATILRFDVGASPEGAKAWFVFTPVFAKLARPF